MAGPGAAQTGRIIAFGPFRLIPGMNLLLEGDKVGRWIYWWRWWMAPAMSSPRLT